MPFSFYEDTKTKPFSFYEEEEKESFLTRTLKGYWGLEKKIGKELLGFPKRSIEALPQLAKIASPAHMWEMAKPLGETYAKTVTGETPVKEAIKATPVLGLPLRTIEDPKETWHEHTLPSLLELGALVAPFKGLMKPKVKPMVKAAAKPTVEEFIPLKKEVPQKTVYGKAEMELAKELTFREFVESKGLNWRETQKLPYKSAEYQGLLAEWGKGERQAFTSDVVNLENQIKEMTSPETLREIQSRAPKQRLSDRDYGKILLKKVKELKAKGVTEKPRKGYRFERKPGIMGGVRSVGQEASVQKVMDALKEAKPIRAEQELLYTKERGARLAKVMAIRKKTTGEAGFYAEKAQLKGELPKLEFESIRSKISQTDIDNLCNTIRDNAFLTEFEKITAREGLLKMFGEYGGRVPTRGDLVLLEQVFPVEFIEGVMAKRPLWTKMKDAGWQLANIPRSMMASFDLSFGGRQGAFAAPRYRKQFWDSWKQQFKIFGSEKAYQASRQALTKHPDFMLAKRSKVSFTELGKIMARREEKFMSQWAEKIPVVGKGIRASSRAYTAFANKFRLDIFSRMVKDAEGMGLNPRNNPYLAKKIGDFVNNATGRGSLGSFETAAVALNAVFFSPRLNVARLKILNRTLNPVAYLRQPKFVRRQALKTVLTASGTAVTILTLADLMGAEAGVNPLSADFGKIKIGNTRIDMLAGFGQFMRAGAQLIAGKTVSSVTGKETILGEGYKPRTRLDIFLQQVEYKESPIASFATTLMKGKDFAGKDVSIPKEVGKRFVPMVVADIIDLAKEDPQLLPLGIPAIFGVGLQTYGHPYAKLSKAEKEYGFMSEQWKRVRDELEKQGFKYKYKAYEEFKKGNP